MSAYHFGAIKISTPRFCDISFQMSEYEDGMSVFFCIPLYIEFEYEYDDMNSGSSAAGSALEVENMYYEADDYWISNPKRSLELFIRLASQESPRNHTDATW